MMDIVSCDLIRYTSWVGAVFLQKIFRFLLRMFEELRDTSNKYFKVRVKILETVDRLQFCLVMLDTGCEDLVLKMFKCFFSVVRFGFPPPGSSIFHSAFMFVASMHFFLRFKRTFLSRFTLQEAKIYCKILCHIGLLLVGRITVNF